MHSNYRILDDVCLDCMYELKKIKIKCERCPIVKLKIIVKKEYLKNIKQGGREGT